MDNKEVFSNLWKYLFPPEIIVLGLVSKKYHSFIKDPYLLNMPFTHRLFGNVIYQDAIDIYNHEIYCKRETSDTLKFLRERIGNTIEIEGKNVQLAKKYVFEKNRLIFHDETYYISLTQGSMFRKVRGSDEVYDITLTPAFLEKCIYGLVLNKIVFTRTFIS
jgi:hypothetical protein